MQSSLAPSSRSKSALDSPGSSIFDLPAAASVTPSFRPRGVNTELRDTSASEGVSFLVVSGGTGCNAICAAFGWDACYVLPVSDDGGSSSEIIRVVGGPSIGDIRSRLVRLIPSAPSGSTLDAIRNLLEHRISSKVTDAEARVEWREIVEGRHSIWTNIPNDRKETIRGYLVYFESEVLRRAHKNFSFANGSIGNFFIASMTLFFRSLPAAIFLFSSITTSQATILPVIVTNHTVTIAAELENSDKIFGQCEISHPVHSSPTINVTSPTGSGDSFARRAGRAESFDGMLHGTRQARPNVTFEQNAKDEYVPLQAKIERIFYINAYGQEIHPSPNPDFIDSLGARDVLVYSCGSLWTSIIPCLALRGVGQAIAKSHSLRAKILLLNGENDRETEGYTAADYIAAITRTLNAAHTASGATSRAREYPVSAFVTHLVYLQGTKVVVDVGQVTNLGVKCVAVTQSGTRFDAASTREAIDRILTED